MSAAIDIREVWKAYPRFETTRPRARWRRREQRWALRDVTIAVDPGEMVGLVGPNGAGKSSLLRLASGLGRPTRGTVSTRGESVSVLNLGALFDPELSGRENAHTAAMLMGFSGRRALDLVPAILRWAELEGFSEAPVRTYSEGMKLRLAFAVVAQLEPRALLLDEVLAVGDAHFQAKCLERIAEMRAGGTGVLFASHSLDQVGELCDRAVWLERGEVRMAGPAADVVRGYRDQVRVESLARTPRDIGAVGSTTFSGNRLGSQEMTIGEVALTGPDGRPAEVLTVGDPLELSFVLDRGGRDETPVVGVALHRMHDWLVVYDSSTEAERVPVPRGERIRVRVGFTGLDLLPGEYAFDVGVYDPTWSHAYDFHHYAYVFRVAAETGEKGVFRPAHRWTLEAEA